jgi:hypothetical protein
MSTKFLGKQLPSDDKSWKNETLRYPGSGSIHELDSANSASEITVQQFLSLRVLWERCDPKLLNDDKRAALYGSSKSEMQVLRDKDKPGKVKGKSERQTPWQAYLEAITPTSQSGPKLRRSSRMPENLGVFALVLQSQLEVSQMEASFRDSNKLSITPLKPRYELRPKAASQGGQGKGTSNEPRAQIQPSPHRSDNSKDSSGARNVSPMAPELARGLTILDEQIVNTAATNFLNALFIHEDRSADWTLQRKQFKFKSEFVKFEARCDGHLQVHGHDRSAAILEVKPRPRYHESGFRIEMQESAQMALWIFQEPNSHWVPPSGGNTY